MEAHFGYPEPEYSSPPVADLDGFLGFRQKPFSEFHLKIVLVENQFLHRINDSSSYTIPYTVFYVSERPTRT